MDLLKVVNLIKNRIYPQLMELFLRKVASPYFMKNIYSVSH